jgi:hypothetical protein
MKINAKTYRKVNALLLALALTAIITEIAFFLLPGTFSTNFILGISGLVIILLQLYRGPVHFKYDTEGEVMNLSSSDPIWGVLLSSFNKHYEFPKRKFHHYKIRRGLGRRKLIIYISSKQGGYKERSMMISYLSSSQFEGLENSLKKYSYGGKNGRRKSGSGQRGKSASH